MGVRGRPSEHTKAGHYQPTSEMPLEGPGPYGGWERPCDVNGDQQPPGYKTFLMFISIEHEISTTYKTKIPTNEDYFFCFKSLRCCIYRAYKC